MYLGLGLSIARLKGSRGEAAFSPASLFASGEEGAWYDPSPTTCFTNMGRTMPASVGDAVAAITDLSGNGNHATHSQVPSRPLLQQTVGGLYYLDSDGVDDALSWTAPTDTDYTVAYVNTAGAATILTGLAMSGATDILLDPALVGYLAVDRALTSPETAGLTAYLEGLAA